MILIKDSLIANMRVLKDEVDLLVSSIVCFFQFSNSRLSDRIDGLGGLWWYSLWSFVCLKVMRSFLTAGMMQDLTMLTRSLPPSSVVSGVGIGVLVDGNWNLPCKCELYMLGNCSRSSSTRLTSCSSLFCVEGSGCQSGKVLIISISSSLACCSNASSFCSRVGTGLRGIVNVEGC